MPPLLSAAAALLRYSVAHTQQHRLFHFRSQQQSVASTCILKTMPKAVPAVAPASPAPKPSAVPAKASAAPKPKAVPAVAPAPPAPGQPAVAPSANFIRGERVFCKRNNKARVGIVMAVHSDQDPVIYEVQFPQQPNLERWSGVLKYTEKISEWPSYAEFQVGHEVQGVHGFADVVDDGSAGSCRFHDAVQDEDTFGSVRIQMYLHLDLVLDLDVARQVLPRWVS